MPELKTIDNEKKADQENGTAIPGLRHSVTEERLLGQLFQGYFNNKMSLLIFLIRTKNFRLNWKSAQLVCGFLDDIYRHMLGENVQKQYRRKFIWLKGFFQRIPNVRPVQSVKAIELIRSLYDVFGIDLKKELGGGKK